jgi:hypothetical protein
MTLPSLKFSFLTLFVLSLSCGPKLTLPPKIDLTKYQGVGVMGFGCNAEGKMDEYATRRFIIIIKAYQKEIRLIDLGTKKEVLESVQKEQLNPEAIRSIGNKYNVDVIFTGELEIKEIQPLVPVNIYSRTRPTRGKTQIQGQRAKAAVKAWLSAKLWETGAGGTIWRSSAQGEEIVNQVSFISETKAIFDATDQQGAFFDLINPMVKQITADFKRRAQEI